MPRFIHKLSELPEGLKGTVLTMGDFDGLHTGHHTLIASTIKEAHERGLLSVLLTYEPSPKKILKKLDHDSRLTTTDEKERLLENTALDMVIFYPVTAETLSLSARTFLRGFLLQNLKLRHLVMGLDHHFGHNRRGNAQYLKAAARRYGFSLEIIEDQLSLEKRSSSTRIRHALQGGDIAVANTILGYAYSVSGEVIHGEQKGRTIGFPTANLRLNPDKLLPQVGVYYGEARLHSGEEIPAVANLGYRPTVGGKSLGFEVHLLDFSGSLYGENLQFSFLGFIRGEKKFVNLEALQAQIHEDCQTARRQISIAKTKL